MPVRTFRKIIPFSGFLVLLAAFTFGRLANDSYPLPSAPIGASVDFNTYFYPSLVYLHTLLRAGHLPLWNPYQMAGVPFAALHQPGALYPPLLAVAWLPPAWAATAHVLSHLLLAGAGTYLFCRRLGVTRAAAFLGGSAYMLAKVVVLGLFTTAYLSCYTWLPFVFLGIQLCRERNSRYGTPVLAAAVALVLLSGYSQGALYVVQAGAAYGIFLFVTGAERSRFAARLLAAAGLGFSVAAVQLAITAEHAALATRSLAGLSLAEAGLSVPTEQLARGFLRGGHWTTIPLISVPAALAALFGSRQRPAAIFFVLMAALAFDFMRGPNGWVFPLYYQLPLGDVFRLPIRAAFVYVFFVAVLVSLGVAVLIRAVPVRARYIATAALVALVCAELYVRSDLPERYLPLTDPHRLMPPPPLREFLTSHGHLERVFIETDVEPWVPYKWGQAVGAFVIPDYEPFLPRVYQTYFGVPEDELWHARLYVAMPPGAPLAELNTSVRLLDLLSARYYVDEFRRRPRNWPSLAEVVAGKRVPGFDVVAYERSQALPRAYVVHQVAHARNHAHALELIRDPSFDPYTSAVVEGNARIPDAAVRGAFEYVQFLRYEPNLVALRAQCASRCLVVLTDLFYPGWRVFVDDEPGTVVRVNALVRGVVVDAGKHDIVYSYLPKTFVGGSIVSAGGLLALGLLLIRARRSANRPPPGDRARPDEAPRR